MHTYTTTTHYLELDGVDYPTTFLAYDYLPHRLTVLDDGTHELIYGTPDEDPTPWSDAHDGDVVKLIRTAPDNKYIDLDTPDDDVAELHRIADELASHPLAGREVAVTTECNVAGGDCTGGDAHDKHDTYRVATATTPSAPYAWETELVLDGYGDLPSTDGAEDMLTAWKDGETETIALMAAYARRGMPGRTFVDWSVIGYSQGDWSEGYAYSDELDAEGIDTYVDEYAAHFRGDVYIIVREEYEIDEDGDMIQLDYECVGGFVGDEYAARTIRNGDAF